jgi:hypothetical protein
MVEFFRSRRLQRSLVVLQSYLLFMVLVAFFVLDPSCGVADVLVEAEVADARACFG